MKDKFHFEKISCEEAFDWDNEFSDICLECGEHFLMCICENESFEGTTQASNSGREELEDDEIPF